MADTKISDLSAATLTGTEEFPLAKAGANYKSLLTSIRDWLKGDLVQVQTINHSGSGSRAIDYSAGQHVVLNVSANITSMTVTNWPTSGKLARLTIEVISSGAFTVPLPSGVLLVGGTAYTVTPSGKDTVILTTTDAGSTVRAYVAGQAFA